MPDSELASRGFDHELAYQQSSPFLRFSWEQKRGRTRRASVAEPDPDPVNLDLCGQYRIIAGGCCNLRRLYLNGQADMRGITEYCESMNVPNNMVEIARHLRLSRSQAGMTASVEESSSSGTPRTHTASSTTSGGRRLIALPVRDPWTYASLPTFQAQ
jgi:hypothetical protein